MMTQFTDRARRVMELATEEAHRVGRQSIAPEHILLGLCKEGTGTGAHVLKSLLALYGKGDLSNIVQQVEQFREAGSKKATSGEPPLNGDAQMVLTRAAKESQRLNHNWLGTEHLLLGLSRCPDGVVADVFQWLGTSADELREETLACLGITSLQVSERHVAQSVRQAITVCCGMLSSQEKSLDQLESEMLRIVEQELADFRDTNPSSDTNDGQ